MPHEPIGIRMIAQHDLWVRNILTPRRHHEDLRSKLGVVGPRVVAGGSASCSRAVVVALVESVVVSGDAGTGET